MLKFWKKLINTAFSQRTTIILLLLAQVLFLVFTFIKLSEYSTAVYYGFTFLGLLLAIYILNKPENPAYKLAWIIPLLAIPVFATVAYFILSNQYSTKRVRNAHIKKCACTKPYLRQDEQTLTELNIDNKNIYRLAGYVDKYGGYPIHNNTTAEYFKIGEEKFAAMVRELKKAEHFIFMEYFIIDQGEMWSEIEKILLEKSAAGVEVRLLYDGMGSQHLLPFRYDKKLRAAGIKCRVFNPFRPMLSSIQNNRDHRKICVIDGHTAFNGGVNLADEYINRKERFGHWKDSAVMIKGDAVWNFTMMFLQMWEITDGEGMATDYDMYRPENYQPPENAEGYVLPYGDSPLDTENVGELVYLDIINNARDYVYITTPYLIPDNELVTALGYAAKSGVDVRIITPGIPDKWYCRSIAKSYYSELTALGVKIYEYDGFIHAKNFVSDDTTAVVGTINLDYRSLYLHFECATYMYKNPAVLDVKADFLETVKNHCVEVTPQICAERSLWSRLVSGILRIFAPLL
ncbi:MAG: cardiolipin synthase [Oscillospiraceae bacterium]